MGRRLQRGGVLICRKFNLWLILRTILGRRLQRGGPIVPIVLQKEPKVDFECNFGSPPRRGGGPVATEIDLNLNVVQDFLQNTGPPAKEGGGPVQTVHTFSHNDVIDFGNEHEIVQKKPQILVLTTTGEGCPVGQPSNFAHNVPIAELEFEEIAQNNAGISEDQSALEHVSAPQQLNLGALQQENFVQSRDLAEKSWKLFPIYEKKVQNWTTQN